MHLFEDLTSTTDKSKQNRDDMQSMECLLNGSMLGLLTVLYFLAWQDNKLVHLLSKVKQLLTVLRKM